MEKKRRSYRIAAVIYLICGLLFLIVAICTSEFMYRLLYYALTLGSIIIAFLQYTMSIRVDQDIKNSKNKKRK